MNAIGTNLISTHQGFNRAKVSPLINMEEELMAIRCQEIGDFRNNGYQVFVKVRRVPKKVSKRFVSVITTQLDPKGVIFSHCQR